ncbi:MAG: trigger factor [Bacillota bacterium]|nr:trigger factor [Bacillota bacterium]
MKSTFIGKEKNDVSFKLEFTAEDFDAAVIKAYQANKGRYSVDGFRRGKAPRKLIEAHYGEDVFFEPAINDLFADAYPAALEELKLDPVDRPRADFGEEQIEKGKGFDVTVTVTVAPEVELKDYKGVEIKKLDGSVSDEAVEQELKSVQNRNARLVLVERPAQEGDTVLLDYTGYMDGEPFEGGAAERQPLALGSGSFIPGFEEQLVGAVSGEERDVKLSFPEDYYAEELAGREAVFKCKVHEIKEKQVDEINDDFAKEVSEFDTLDEYKADIRAKLEKTAAEKVEREMRNAVIEKVYEANEIDIPEVMVEDQISEMLNEFGQQLQYQGLDLEKYLEYTQKDMKEFRETMREDAYKRVKTRLLVKAVADAENLEVNDEEMEAEYAKVAEAYGMEPEKVKTMMGAEGAAYIAEDVRNRKAVDFLYEAAVIK